MERKMEPQQLENFALEENWKPVDDALSSMDEEELEALLPSARRELQALDGNLQDLGASIFQKYSGGITGEDKLLLRGVTQKPGNEFARYRAGFALWVHGERTEYVRKILEEAKSCADVSEIAEQLLKE
jgi:hypothetical protein